MLATKETNKSGRYFFPLEIKKPKTELLENGENFESCRYAGVRRRGHHRWATARRLAAGYGQIPVHVLPLFYAMMFGATLGGNGTMFDASSNIIAAGICLREGRRLGYVDFARYGIPVMLVQLIVSAIYLKFRFLR